MFKLPLSGRDTQKSLAFLIHKIAHLQRISWVVCSLILLQACSSDSSEMARDKERCSYIYFLLNDDEEGLNQSIAGLVAQGYTVDEITLQTKRNLDNEWISRGCNLFGEEVKN